MTFHREKAICTLINSVGTKDQEKKTIMETKESDLLCFKKLYITTKKYFIQSVITETEETITTFIIN